jgi:hypothetical protein
MYQEKRSRRTRSEVGDMRAALKTLIAPHVPVTVRQAFYLAVSAGLIDKTENAYKNLVIPYLTNMRLEDELPFDWIADSTRWRRKPVTHNSLDDALQETANFYRRNIWQNQDVYIEIWLEKEALAGVLYQATAAWDVPLMVSRGYASISYLYEAAQTIRDMGKASFIYYFGDHDPSGLDIPRNVERRLREFAPDADIHFERVAVNPWQIVQWGLPMRPTKTSDARSKHFIGDSVEVDSIPPHQLRALATECIEQHVNQAQLRILKVAEDSERTLLTRLYEHKGTFYLSPEDINDYHSIHADEVEERRR